MWILKLPVDALFGEKYSILVRHACLSYVILSLVLIQKGLRLGKERLSREVDQWPSQTITGSGWRGYKE
jgi:hypothetical protein